ncbi:MAG: hypothetical protein ACOYO7_06145 [Phycisphaerales bacterium]|jgi:hypothetical protein
MNRIKTTGPARAIALAMAMGAALLHGAPLSAAPPRGGWQDGSLDPRLDLRRRWWLDIYAHSMQEECFIRWMDDRLSGPEWKLGLSIRRVEATWAWWRVHVWPTIQKPDGDK